MNVKNYLLFVPSLLSGRSKQIHYKTKDSGQIYEGLQTNEAMTKYLMDSLEQNGEHLDKIIMLCTPEVRDMPVSVAGGKTTLDYYRDVIGEYRRQNYPNVGTGGEELFEAVPFSMDNHGSVYEMLNPLEQIIKAASETGVQEKKKVYVDFTGGVRNAALALVFACRILQASGVEVERILYSNLVSPEKGLGEFEDCTETYRIFDLLATRLEIKYGDTRKAAEYLDRLTGEDRNAFQEMLERVDAFHRAKGQNQVNRASREAAQLARYGENGEDRSLDPVTRILMEEVLEKARPYAEEGEEVTMALLEEHIENRDTVRALTLGIEEMVDVWLSAGVFRVNYSDDRRKAWLKDEIKGVFMYYNDESNRENWRTVLRTAAEYVHALCQNPDREPVDVWNEYFGEDFFELWGYRGETVPTHEFSHNQSTRRRSMEKILPALNRRMQQLKDRGLSEEEWNRACVEEYQRLDLIYTSSGFPYACTFGSSFWEEYGGENGLYGWEFRTSIELLQKLYFGEAAGRIVPLMKMCKIKEPDYRQIITLMDTNKGVLRKLFPFMLLRSHITSDRVHGRAWDELIYDFASTFCKVNSVRNRLVHTNPKVTDEEIDNAMAEIRRLVEIARSYS